jgi:hypothetical protein
MSLPPLYTGASGILAPIVALNAWTFLIEGWMYKTRIPAFNKIKNIGPHTLKHDLDKQTPPEVRWKADNYNHLMEQPTQFYAVALVLSALGMGHNSVDVGLAWTYVGLRVGHSLVHCTTNPIMVRFSMFVTSSAVLAVMTGRAAMRLLQ